ncbi:High-affinity branched-chain amino acid transport system permease protein LivH [Myxococcaceae bacterium]|nr:High-affinity branched-chain amino acid transport system permease protein LivH [Myxococcaceae bacterium]
MAEDLLQQLVNGVAWGGIYALIALGYTMVYGVLKLINFAHGEVYMVGAMTGYYAARSFGLAGAPSLLGLVATLAASMAVCALLAAIIERVAYRPLRSAPRLAPLITAIGVSLLLQNLGQLVFGADPKFFPPLLESRNVFEVGKLSVSNVQLAVLGTAILLMAALQWIVMRTRFGRAMRAVSFDAQAAALMGVPVDRVILGTFVLGAVLAAAAGVLVGLTNPKIDPLMGVLPGLKAFVAAVLGGIGNIPGAMVGGLLLGVIETFVSGYLSSTYRDAIAFVLLIAILLYKPTGLFGTTQTEKV